jgi:monoamine oxidase
LPVALTACKTDYDRTEIKGGIIGASNNIGHILRERRNWEIPKEAEEVGVVIVGGGVAGLSAAWKLKRSGFEDFRLLELEPRMGGTSASDTVSIDSTGFNNLEKNSQIGYPWGAHYLPVPFKENKELVELLDEMDLVESRDEAGEVVIHEQHLTRDPEERVFYKGRWYEGLYLHAGESDEDVKQKAKFEKLIDYWTDWKDSKGKRAFAVPVGNCSTDSEVTNLDRISFAEWLRLNGLNSERLLWYCDYACRDDFGLRLKQTSAWAGLFYFCSRVPRSGLESQPFITFPEGNGRFVRHFVSNAKGKIEQGKIVVEIIPTESGADIVSLDTKTQKIEKLRAKQVIFSAPLFTAKYLIRDFEKDAPFSSKEFQHNSWFVANLFLKARPVNRFQSDFPLSWDNVLYESESLGYVTATHQQGMDYGPTILTYYYAMATEKFGEGMTKLLALDWKELADICFTDLSQAHPDIRQLTERIDIMRWGHAMISPRTDFVWRGEREKTAKPFRNIHFAHSDMSGIAIFEEAFYHGLAAAGAASAAMDN